MPVLTLPAITRRAFGFALTPWGASVLRGFADPMCWALLSDTHVPADPSNEHRKFRPFEELKKVVPEVVAAKPDGALLWGDLARLEGLAGDYQNLKTLLEPVTAEMPVAFVLGNHDDRKNFLAAFGSSQPGAQPR